MRCYVHHHACLFCLVVTFKMHIAKAYSNLVIVENYVQIGQSSSKVFCEIVYSKCRLLLGSFYMPV